MQQQMSEARVLRGIQGHAHTHSSSRTPTKMTAEQQTAVVDRHNQLRASRNATHQPCTAADMEVMVWDDQLAADAQAYADGCVGDHAEGAGSKFGENIFIQFPDTSYTGKDLVSGVQSWHDEIVDTVWDINDRKVTSKPLDKCTEVSGDSCNVGHYFQVIWAKSNKIGCGVSSCTSSFSVSGSDYKTGVLMVCRYDAPASLGAGQTNSLPYMYGKPCAACPGHCSNGLCTAPPIRCLDKLGGDNTIDIGSKKYTSCGDLVKDYGADSQMPWCTQLAPMMQGEDLCKLSCGKCKVPAGVGAQYCGGGTGDGAAKAVKPKDEGQNEKGEGKQIAKEGKGEGEEDGNGKGEGEGKGEGDREGEGQSEGGGEGEGDDEDEHHHHHHVKGEDEADGDGEDDHWGNWTYAEDEGGEKDEGENLEDEPAEDGWTDPWGDEDDEDYHEESDEDAPHEKDAPEDDDWDWNMMSMPKKDHGKVAKAPHKKR